MTRTTGFHFMLILLRARVYTSYTAASMRTRPPRGDRRRVTPSIDNTDRQRRRSRILAIAATAIVVVFAAALGVAWRRYVPHAVTSVNGEPLGRLPAGV